MPLLYKQPIPCNAKEREEEEEKDDFWELVLHSLRNQEVEKKELGAGLEDLGVAGVDFSDSHLWEVMERGDEGAMVVGSNVERVKRRRVMKKIKAQMEMVDCALVKMLELWVLVVDFKEEGEEEEENRFFLLLIMGSSSGKKTRRKPIPQLSLPLLGLAESETPIASISLNLARSLSTSLPFPLLSFASLYTPATAPIPFSFLFISIIENLRG